MKLITEEMVYEAAKKRPFMLTGTQLKAMTDSLNAQIEPKVQGLVDTAKNFLAPSVHASAELRETTRNALLAAISIVEDYE